VVDLPRLPFEPALDFEDAVFFPFEELRLLAAETDCP
jgi:hypothetical protein